MKKIKQITIRVETKDEDFGMIFLKKEKIVEILGDKKTLLSSFLKSLLSVNNI